MIGLPPFNLILVDFTNAVRNICWDGVDWRAAAARCRSSMLGLHTE
jgi:hypothetical protein